MRGPFDQDGDGISAALAGRRIAVASVSELVVLRAETLGWDGSL